MLSFFRPNQLAKSPKTSKYTLNLKTQNKKYKILKEGSKILLNKRDYWKIHLPLTLNRSKIVKKQLNRLGEGLKQNGRGKGDERIEEEEDRLL